MLVLISAPLFVALASQPPSLLTLLSGPWEAEAWRGCSWGVCAGASPVGGAGAVPHIRARCHGSHLYPGALALLPALRVRPGLTVGSSR